MTTFSIQAMVNGPQCDLLLSGEVDLQVTDAFIEVALSRMAETGVQRLLVDLGAVTFIDSSGLGALVAIRNATKEQGKEIVLRNVPDRIRKLLTFTGVDRVFAISSNDASPAQRCVQQSAAEASQSDAPTDPQLRIVPT